MYGHSVDGDRRLGRTRELGILAQDGGLEVDQLGARFDPELLDQGGARHGEGAEGVGLPAAAVLGQGEDGPAPLAERFLGDQRSGIGGDAPVVSGREAGVEQVLLDRAAQLLEPGRFAAAGCPAVERFIGTAAPGGQGALERRGRPVLVAGGGKGSAPLDHPLEPIDVDVVAGEREPVSAGSGLDGVGAEHLPQVCDADLDLLVRRRWGVVTPEGVGELVPTDDLAPTHGERCQCQAIPRVRGHRRCRPIPAPEGSLPLQRS